MNILKKHPIFKWSVLVLAMLTFLMSAQGNTVTVLGQDTVQTTLSLKPYLPFYHFIEFNYQGDQKNYSDSSMILEFNRDAEGKFQIVAITDHTQTAIVYQVTDLGLYELARFADYMDVQDLRYTDAANDGRSDLVFPMNVTEGMTFQGGQNNASQMTVQEKLDTLEMNGKLYEDIIVIRERRGQQEFDHYYAPKYGLIAVEERFSDESKATVFQLLTTGGYLSD